MGISGESRIQLETERGFKCVKTKLPASKFYQEAGLLLLVHGNVCVDSGCSAHA